MPCGCSGGTWQPPEPEKTKGEQSKQTAGKPEPVSAGAVGPAAPGYYHGPDR